MSADAFLLRRKLSSSRMPAAAVAARVVVPGLGTESIMDDGEPFDTLVLDLDEHAMLLCGDGTQTNDANDGARSDRTSHVALRPAPGVEIVQRFLEEIGSAQLTLTMHLYEVDRAMGGIAERKATRVATTTLATRLGELDTLRDALNDLYMAAATPEVADALAQDGAFTEYLRGVYAWAEAVLRALSILCTELCVLAPDWFRLRSRLNDASDFYLGDLEGDVLQTITQLRRGVNGKHPTTLELEERVGSLLIAAGRLYAGLALRFG